MTALQRTKHAAKVVVSFLLHGTGTLWLWQLVALRNKAVVLMYHRVLTVTECDRCGSHPAIVVGRETFARHLEVLRRRFVILSLEQFVSHLERRVPFPSSSCLITFDDGWRDNSTNALPLLRGSGCPAVVFLPVAYIGRQRLFWRESLTHLMQRVLLEIQHNPSRRTRFEEILEPFELDRLLDRSEADPKPAIVEALGRSSLAPLAAEGLVRTLLATLDIEAKEIAADDPFMSWQDVEVMAQAGVAFGGHGSEHHRLTDLSAEAARVEIEASKEVIAEKFPGAVPAFSYPNGCFTPEISAMVKQAGYRLAFTTRSGRVRHDDDPFTLKRLNIQEGMTETTAMFLARILGLW